MSRTWIWSFKRFCAWSLFASDWHFHGLFACKVFWAILLVLMCRFALTSHVAFPFFSVIVVPGIPPCFQADEILFLLCHVLVRFVWCGARASPYSILHFLFNAKCHMLIFIFDITCCVLNRTRWTTFERIKQIVIYFCRSTYYWSRRLPLDNVVVRMIFYRRTFFS